MGQIFGVDAASGVFYFELDKLGAGCYASHSNSAFGRRVVDCVSKKIDEGPL